VAGSTFALPGVPPSEILNIALSRYLRHPSARSIAGIWEPLRVGDCVPIHLTQQTPFGGMPTVTAPFSRARILPSKPHDEAAW
jgi:hypothetical protein